MASLLVRLLFWTIFFATAVGFYLYAKYCSVNNTALTRIPSRVLELSPVRWGKADFYAVAKKLDEAPVVIEEHLPPKTGRKYDCGWWKFLGGWIIIHLLKRGESPANIRIIDQQPPTRLEFTSGPAKEVQFVAADISKSEQAEAAFKAPWPDASSPTAEITVFHCAEVFRFHDRHRSFLPVYKFNVVGTEHVINASRAIGASILIFTSSATVAQRYTRLLLIPWLEKEPKHFFQVLGDQELNELPKTLEEFACCYSHSKLEAETMVRNANKCSSGLEGKGRVLRTGCIRPGNGIYGPGGGLWERLRGQNNVSFFSKQNFCNVYVENCSLAHLLYEQRLVELSSANGESTNPDIGGQAFTVTDPAQPFFWSDHQAAMVYFSRGQHRCAMLASTPFILQSYLIERYYIVKYYLRSHFFLAWIGKYLPPLRANLVTVQPAFMAQCCINLVADDSRARLPPSQGGLGYKGPWSALEGLCKSVKLFEEAEYGT
ncbi:hypothetical protein BT96DRAFT_111764 [Gymnopus androsaceus JB14]|uniref:3-beta hydroxysteroid dehydrogenase/isomerase domain-containing protein n=1 Tax=Gymnopus androsaceus JB14 TaxID=1447944 RepID=A0A6A4HFK3_9AGAR|nr:hypothetical protein BT96DRAFT_111764 [Gymnopus androsaceus JB14]